MPELDAMDSKEFIKLVKRRLRKADRLQRIEFAQVCALRALPYLVTNNGFEYWRETKHQNLLCVFRALDTAGLVCIDVAATVYKASTARAALDARAAARTAAARAATDARAAARAAALVGFIQSADAYVDLVAYAAAGSASSAAAAAAANAADAAAATAADARAAAAAAAYAAAAAAKGNSSDQSQYLSVSIPNS